MMLKTQAMPEYVDGCFDLFDIVDRTDDENPSFPVRKILSRGIPPIWYREISIYDHSRATLNQVDVEPTMKVRIPRWDGISSNCVCVVNGREHKVYNKTDVVSKQGFPETELTLIAPEMQYEVTET